MTDDYMEIIQSLPDTMNITCSCGHPLTLSNEGGQYPESYVGDCSCGMRWELINLNALFAEQDEEHTFGRPCTS